MVGFRERGLSSTLVATWITFMGYVSGFPLANHLPGSQHIVGISQAPPMCVHASLSQDGFYCQGLWVEHPLMSLPFWLPGLSAHVWSARCPDNKKDMVWAGPSLLPQLSRYSHLEALVQMESISSCFTLSPAPGLITCPPTKLQPRFKQTGFDFLQEAVG